MQSFNASTPICSMLFNNLSGYDLHFIVRQLGNDTKSISVIPNTEENLISFTKYILPEFQIRFFDTCRFMQSSLKTVTNNLARGDKSKFRETAKIFASNDMKYVTQKGFYPCEYTDSWEKLDDSSPSPKEGFYNRLLEKHIKHENYKSAERVWEHFGFKILGEYSDWYMKVDVRRAMCLRILGIYVWTHMA
ncbi:Ribonuclease H-like domain [Cinara cedri]|uniref:Ribonuclease H-like domain n=1 Tax=Cinara cedri TaxID=506608 RepID=A0A5E4NLR0_9HEMI|nr:Ribonuclease H-like domain [Cinara cedri]